MTVLTDLPCFGVHDGARMLVCTPDLAAMFGYAAPDDVIGRVALDFIEPNCRDQAVARIVDTGGGPYESTGLRANGAAFRVEITGLPIRYGGVEARLILVRDLSPIVWVVDDDRVIGNMIRLVFESFGYRVQSFNSGEDALAAFRPGALALLMTDLLMPGMQGAEFGARIRELDADLPILYASGSEKIEDLDANSRFLRKPFGREELMKLLSGMPERARKGLV